MNHIETLKKIADECEAQRVSLLNSSSPFGLIDSLNKRIAALTSAIADMERLDSGCIQITALGEGFEMRKVGHYGRNLREDIDAALKKGVV